jgi:AcrR family transcriptional regulator
MNQLSLRQQEIIETALGIIAEKGIEKFTIKNLAAARGVSEPALYRHFESKQTILILIIAQYRNSIFDLFDHLTVSGLQPSEIIESFYLEVTRRFTDKPALSTILFSEELFRHNKRLAREIDSIIHMMHARIEIILKKAKVRKELQGDVPCKDLAWIIMGAMRLLIIRWRLEEYSYDPVKEAKGMLKSLRKLIYL